MNGSGADRLHPALLYHVLNTLQWRDLRPFQEAAVEPLLRGADALLLAPTAGGKTEAAVFPLLTRMAAEGWRGLSLLYVCPLRALLDDLAPRLAGYASWVGRRSAIRHGATPASTRRSLLRDPPDLLLTTPESLEATLVSALVDARQLFAGLRAVIVDEVHAFAGDDRGWHLLAVLERLSRLAGRPLQRVGLSATVGDPGRLLAWLQGSGHGRREGVVVDPAPAAGAGAEVRLDYVGSIENAATVIAALHRGEKRLVFCDSRRRVEDLAAALRARDVSTFVSHSSLSADERRRSERGFAEGRDCVMVATSTLELGIDLGDLDRVVQVDPPGTVAAFLQRLGRTGRRPGSVRNCLLLATDHEALLRAAGLLRLWSRGWVEPVEPPPRPLHLLAHQLLALALQEGRVGRRTWRSWLDGLALIDDEADAVVEHLLVSGFLAVDQGMFAMGPEGERRFGDRNFLELTSVIAADPQLTVLHGRAEVGTIHPLALALHAGGPPLIRLAGRSWRVRQVDWRRRRCQVEPSDAPGRAFWPGAPRALSFELCRAMRDVVLGRPLGVPLTRRAEPALARAVEEHAACADPQGSVVVRDRSGGVRWWTWAGGRANATLAAALREVVADPPRVADCWLRLRPGLEASRLRGSPSELVPMGSPLGSAIRAARDAPLPPPPVEPEVAAGLRFAELLPARLVDAVLAGRLGDPVGAEVALQEATTLIVRAEG